MKIHNLPAYLQVNDAAKAIEFYTSVFRATEKYRLTDANGRIGHAVLDFGGTTLMLAEEFPEYGILGPLTLGGTSVTMHLQVDDADAVIRRAAEAGAEIETEPEDQFYGERSGWLRLEPHILIAVLCAGGSRPTTCWLQVRRPRAPQFFMSISTMEITLEANPGAVDADRFQD